MAKPRKTKLPKSVAGLKLPKDLRKAALVEAFAATPAGRELLADALTAAAGAAAATLLRARDAFDRPETDEADAKPGAELAEAAGMAAEFVSAFAEAAAGALRPESPPPAEVDPAPASPGQAPARAPRSRARSAKPAAPPAEPAASDLPGTAG